MSKEGSYYVGIQYSGVNKLYFIFPDRANPENCDRGLYLIHTASFSTISWSEAVDSEYV
jgi:hypothetical protein